MNKNIKERDFIERTAKYFEDHISQEYCALSPVLGDRLDSGTHLPDLISLYVNYI